MNAIVENEDRAGWRSWLDIHAVNPTRALALMAVGAIVGLLIAGFALFTAEGTSTLIVPPEDVALVNQQPISRSDYLAQLKILYGVDVAHATREQRQKILDDMIREELFVQRGKELDVSGVDPEVRNAMVNAVEQQAAANIISSLPSDAKLRAFYLAHKDDYSSDGLMTVRDIVFPPGAAEAAGRAAAALRSGGQPDAVIARFRGRDSGKVDGEEFYFAAKIHLGDALFAVARTLPSGGVSAPVTASDGWHVLYMVGNRPPVPLDFMVARTKVLDDFQRGAMQRTLTSDEAFLRKRANVLIAEDLR
jgi:parvulin-like peptidyl-prolyl isomerase